MRQHRTVILPSFATIFLCSLLLAASFTAFGAVMRVLSMEKNLYAIEAFLPESVGEDSLQVIQNRLEPEQLVALRLIIKEAGQTRNIQLF